MIVPTHGMRMGIVIEMKALGKHKHLYKLLALSFQGQSGSLVLCPQPQYSFILEGHHRKNLGFTKNSQQNAMQLFLEANRTHQLYVFLFSAQRKLALKGSTDKGDFEKLLTNW